MSLDRVDDLARAMSFLPSRLNCRAQGPFSRCLFSLTLFASALQIASAQGSNNTTNGSNGSNETNCTDNATAVNVVNYSGPPLCAEVPEPPCYKDHCWTTIPREAINSCMELTFWGADVPFSMNLPHKHVTSLARIVAPSHLPCMTSAFLHSWQLQ